MKRISCAERPNWRAKAEELGFVFHSPGGDRYWDESAYYAFTLRQIEDDIEHATTEIVAMCREVVARAVKDEQVLRRLQIPQYAWDYIKRSWDYASPTLYGRLDLRYAGDGPPKLLEYNADTPTSLYEASVFQWYWLEDMKAAGRLGDKADQFNSIHDRLVETMSGWGKGMLHLASVTYEIEDRGTVAYLEDCARQAGLETRFVAIGDIGLVQSGDFVDADGVPIKVLFKLYPWEWLFAEEFGQALPRTPTHFVEPPWKAILSNKGLLPLLWDLAPNHPNLLPSFFEDDPRKESLGMSFARKPLFSREGANVMLLENATVIDRDDGPYGREGYIRQGLAKLPEFSGNYAVIGSWVVAEQAAGIGIREDSSPITKNTSRFVPHAIID